MPAFKSLSLESRVLRPACRQGSATATRLPPLACPCGRRSRLPACSASGSGLRLTPAEQPGMPVSCLARPGAMEEALFDQGGHTELLGGRAQRVDGKEPGSLSGSDLDSAIAKPSGLAPPASSTQGRQCRSPQPPEAAGTVRLRLGCSVSSSGRA